nr:ABC transporter permease [Alteromonas sediminis]
MISFFRYGTLFVLTLFSLVSLSFLLAHLFPGDLLTNLSGVAPKDEKERQLLATLWAVDQSVFFRFFRYCSLIFSGEWGVSISSGLPLYDEIRRTLPATIELSFYSAVVAVVIGVPIGCLAGLKSYTKLDYTINAVAIVNYSLPVFWLGLAFILVFSLQLNWLPLSGRISLLFDIPTVTGFILIDILLSNSLNKGEAIANAIAHLAMPVLAVSLISGAALVRLLRRSVIDILDKPYIASARSRGLSSSRIFFDHVLRNALLPILPLLAIQITTLMTNAIIVETLFSWPGIGDWLLQAIYQGDYTAIRMGMLVVAALIVSLTIFVDILNRLVDPRKRMPTNATT